MKRFNSLLLLALFGCSGLVVRTSPGWTPEILGKPAVPALPDYSFAGYKWGEAMPPRPTATIIAATAFGVIANDGADDTAGLRAAVAETTRVPAGMATAPDTSLQVTLAARAVITNSS